jgi:hypothetical protein
MMTKAPREKNHHKGCAADEGRYSIGNKPNKKQLAVLFYFFG